MERLSWDEICKQYDQQWVHLIDYDWKDGEPYPNSGIVHLHSKSRREFDKLMMEGEPISGARLFVGKVRIDPNIIVMGGFRMIQCE